MKYALLLSALLLAACDQAPTSAVQTAKVEEVKPMGPDGCNIDTSSKLVTEHAVSPILNLEKSETKDGSWNRCTVEFDINVDGQVHHLKESERGLEQMASLCYYARERARKNLLLDLGGSFKSESNIQCKYTDK